FAKKWGGAWGAADEAIGELRKLLGEARNDISDGVIKWKDVVKLTPDKLPLAQSPFQVRMTVSRKTAQGDGDDKDDLGMPLRAWTYVHVLVHSVILAWGDKELIPKAKRANEVTTANWNFQNDKSDKNAVVTEINTAVNDAEAALLKKLQDEYAKHNG